MQLVLAVHPNVFSSSTNLSLLFESVPVVLRIVSMHAKRQQKKGTLTLKSLKNRGVAIWLAILTEENSDLPPVFPNQKLLGNLIVTYKSALQACKQ